MVMWSSTSAQTATTVDIQQQQSMGTHFSLRHPVPFFPIQFPQHLQTEPARRAYASMTNGDLAGVDENAFLASTGGACVWELHHLLAIAHAKRFRDLKFYNPFSLADARFVTTQQKSISDGCFSSKLVSEPVPNFAAYSQAKDAEFALQKQHCLAAWNAWSNAQAAPDDKARLAVLTASGYAEEQNWPRVEAFIDRAVELARDNIAALGAKEVLEHPVYNTAVQLASSSNVQVMTQTTIRHSASIR